MARSFNGSTDVITTGSFTFGSNVTAACWIYVTGGSGIRCIFRNNAGAGGLGNGVCGMYLDGSSIFNGTRDDGNLAASSATISNNIATHVAWTITGGVLSFYVNGVAAGTGTNTGATSSTLKIGLDAFSQAFTGRISDLAIWNTVLSASEILALAAGVRPYRIERASLGGYWPLEGTASPEPDVINGNNGTLTGTSQAANPYNYTTPKYGSRTFNGSNPDKIDCGAATVQSIPNPVSVSAWIYPTTLNSFNQIFMKNEADTNINGMNVISTGALVFQRTGGQLTSAAGAVVVNQWQHVLGTASATNIANSYVNGILVAGPQATGPLTAPNANSTIGIDLLHTARAFTGNIADVAMWNVELTAAEAARLGAGYRPYQVRPSGLIAYYPLQGTASPEPDQVFGNNGTLTGTSAGASPTRYQDIVGA